MRIAHIENGVVTNVSIAPDDFDLADDGTTIASETAAIGDLYRDGTFVSPFVAAPSVEALLAYLDRAHEAHLAKVWTFNVGTEAEPLNVTTRLDDRGQAAMGQILLWAAMLAKPGETLPYSNTDSTPHPITQDQALSLTAQAGAAKIQSSASYNAATAEILAATPTITTLAQIDAIAW